jgi:hypothetical protein
MFAYTYIWYQIVYTYIWWQIPHLYDPWNMNKWEWDVRHITFYVVNADSKVYVGEQFLWRDVASFGSCELFDILSLTIQTLSIST